MGPLSTNKRQTVLIVDDDATNLKVVVEYLKAYSYQILIARDGATGIERAKRGKPDLILLDVVMPGIDGFETCRRLAADPETRDIPVIFMSGRTEVEDKIRGFEAGSVDYVIKPVEERELRARVQAHLKIKLQQEQLAQYAELLEASVSHKTMLVAQEKAQRQNLDKEVERLTELLHDQGKQIQQVTRQWLQDKTGADNEQNHGMVTELLQAHIQQAHALLLSDQEPSPAVAAAERHLAIAQELFTSTTATAQTPVAAPSVPNEPDPFEALSNREREIVVLMVSGHANKEIAYELGIAPTTVSTHRKRIMERLDIGDLPSLVKLALKFGVMS